MVEQHIEILKDNRSAYLWLLGIVVLAISLGRWFAPQADQALIVWLLVAIISLPASLLFIIGTFTNYFDLKITPDGIAFGGYSGRRNFKWEEITDITICGDNECQRIAISLTPAIKKEIKQPRANEVLPKLYGNSPNELLAKLKQWQHFALEQSGKTVARPKKYTCDALFSSEGMAKKERLKTGLQLIGISVLLFVFTGYGLMTGHYHSMGLGFWSLPPISFLISLFLFCYGLKLIIWKFWEK